MITFLAGLLVGAVAFGFFLRNNPKWALKLGVLADNIVEQIEDIKNNEDKK